MTTAKIRTAKKPGAPKAHGTRNAPPGSAPAPTDDKRKSDATRERILDATALVLSREGFSGAKLIDIAREAQLKIATLYYYYPSREALVEAVLVTGSEHVRLHTQQTLDELDPGCSAVDRLCAAVESHLRYVLEISNYTQAVIRNAGQVPEHIRAVLSQEIANYGHLWQRLVDDAAEGTKFRTRTQRRALRLLILGGLNWSVEWWNTTHMPLDDLVFAAVAMTRATLQRATPDSPTCCAGDQSGYARSMIF